MNELSEIDTASEEVCEPQGEERPIKIRERAFTFSLRGIRLFQHLQEQKDGAAWVIGKQFLRAACSVGANVEEAQSAESRADFIHKLGVAQKEARETLYWLRLLGESRIVAKARLNPLIKESGIMIRVLGSIILTTKHGRSGAPKTHNS